MKLLLLVSADKRILLDDTDLQLLGHLYCSISQTNKLIVSCPLKTLRTQYLHRLILQPLDTQVVDHINGNGLDNRRINLRICEQLHNTQNRALNKNSSTGYKGVSRRTATSKFTASIRVKGTKIHLGNFTFAVDAARAYNEAAVKYFGDFARLNKL